MTVPTAPTVSRHPIKVILPNQGKESKNRAGGPAELEPLRPVTRDVRDSLVASIGALQASVTAQLDRVGAVPVRVQLIKRALAKSHRPTRLLSEQTCPIVGAGAHGELFVRASASGLARLRDRLATGSTPQLVKDISTVHSIEPITPVERRKKKSALEILQASPRVGGDGFLTRVRLFDFGNRDFQDRLLRDFRATCSARSLAASATGYGGEALDGIVFAVACRNEEDVDSLARTVGVRSVIGMPRMRTVRQVSFNHSAAPPFLPSRADVVGEFPSVVVVDSGVRSAATPLESWVVGRHQAVAPATRDPSHGTFVAGLIVWGDRLNSDLSGISNEPCGVFDLEVLPNSDPALGETESITEQEFLQTLESALQQYANRFKVWNLSLGTDEVCAEDEFSALAEQLDRLQEQYNVTFVIAAGNYQTPPLLSFPRSGTQLKAGRITAPSDSVLGVTVGAISHVAFGSEGPGVNEPAPFSRHGAGPNHIIKPDLVHYGGSCTIDGRRRSGVISVTDRGIAEDLGTSFAAPLVARSLAQVFHQITPTPSPVLARALLTHHARDPRTGGSVPAVDLDALGFGRPQPPPYCLACSPHESTLVFEDSLRPGFFLEWDHFPFPPSLSVGGKYSGEVRMTVAFAPARSGRWGAEYCETHIDASLGFWRPKTAKELAKDLEKNPNTPRIKFGSEVPPEHAEPGRLYEEVQVAELRKWAPVRSYYRMLQRASGLHWKLKLRLLSRHGVEATEALHSQPFALVISIRDPKGVAPVYDEMAVLIRNQYKSQNLSVRPAARIQTRP